MDMKRAISFAAIITTMSLTGCAGLQQQASSYMPGSQPAQPAVASYEGGQQVQFIPGNAKATNTSYQATTNNGTGNGQQESSFMGDMMKSATDTVKSEASSTVRSTVRGLFSR
ncbi:hypothetical protein ALP96_03871 [Pseudomonas savastanoi pv. glycinea]|uniref:Lipoprotein n=2 Tax=Pseudomonas TaxID=286 RepID=A0AAW3MA27_PSESS|nr:hypothetical protein AO287_26560 [Pseudomonas savastanoi]RMM60381.1 hypothetical protein ALQ75_02772 [Pseudomonas savastanoi pv. glycinea]RMP90691.1 hypothetical protein ALQ13_02672 [Pseudomonas savastanoi pv. glycinea]RMQ90076.1 hypothetical protein ALP96_03871 [Pseudomonas savastanoi pv. glycinea]RMQ95225.1 hypothetical protein ALP95_03411 [Pseudomonas savastanoi pv. glycinea]